MSFCDHVSTDEIIQDIKDSEDEISKMEREVPAPRILGDRMSHFRADGKIQGVEERKEFIKKLKFILKDRGVDL